ncbi:hypothetical protein SAMN05216464_112139 [Mucilaginibacter pineti]|uniref:Uncharacterized protein n=1 Tax=Mucilaginibacter pineti TaxID=1391627 RepID=A0A1G7I3X9_9SPHI|nr:hypothetical protein [Mucilaginibacter pineti]SDF07298.1 hypothetical protein SAMN05216464_112139 [Mucilaginibacter pineti]
MRSIKSLILLSFVFGVVTLNSCKKDKKDEDNTPLATISASVDGTATNFNTGAIAAQVSINGANFTSLEGTAENKTSMSIIISGTPVAGKTYSNGASNDEDKPLLAYFVSDDERYFSDDNDQTNPASLTITSVTSTTVKGTFKGNLVYLTGANGTTKKKAITNGKFNLTLTKQ